jgi:hypothetical protein
VAREETKRTEQDPLGPEPGDVVLEELVRLADEDGLEVGITVYIGGTLISGVLTSGRQWFDAVGTRMQSARGPEETKGALMHFFRAQRNQAFPSSGEADADGKETPPVGFIHLREARPFDAEGPYLREGVLWRGRLDRIDGFNFGLVNDSGPRHPRPS